MKNLILVFICLIAGGTAYSQTVSEIYQILESSNNYDEIKDKMKLFPLYSVTLQSINSLENTSPLDSIVLDKRENEIYTIKNTSQHYKILKIDSSTSIRVSYIYFNAFKMKREEIHKLRDDLLLKLNNGESFSELAKLHSMDVNSTNGGDLGWKDVSILDKNFVKEIINHAKGDLFKIDIPANNWYYIVLKSHTDKHLKTSTFIQVKSN